MTVAKIEGATDLDMMLGDWNTAKFTPEGLTHLSTKTRLVNGIFNKEFLEDNGIVSSQPEFRCKSSDVEDATNGAKITVDNEFGDAVTYTIRGVEPNGLGLTYLLLEKD